jgi:hypothetical protein
MEKEWGGVGQGHNTDGDIPRFASHVVLRRGTSTSEREYTEWCRWVAERLAEDQRNRRPKNR